MSAAPLLQSTGEGLLCVEGGFHVDPWRPVKSAVITHAHADHASWGCETYLCSDRCGPVLRARLAGARVETLAYGRRVRLGNTWVSLHPAGHIVGSAQVRVERAGASAHGAAGEVWVVTGDCKTAPDPTCDAFEPVRCDTLIVESTFALPVYRWKDQREVFDELNAWWRENAAMGRTSLVFAYALGKAQRVLAGVDPSIGPLGAHGQVLRMNRACEEAGVKLPEVCSATGDSREALRGRGLVVAPPSVNASVWMRSLRGPEGVSTAFVSGWMAVRGSRRRRAVDRGFVLSDHADWPGLLELVEASGARRVGVTHGFAEVLSRWLREERGLESFVVPSRFEGETGEETQSLGPPGPAGADASAAEEA